MLLKDRKLFFSSHLLHWHSTKNTRSMPWKNEKDPYKIWLSEIILQQTRVSQGLEYYEKLVEKYPTIGQLAAAKEQEVFKQWEGLGYYSRCRNMIATARYISLECGGKFPDKYDEIISLKGIGPYTASAIASFAFNKPYAVVDGNVFRVLSRYFCINSPVDTSQGKKQFALLAQQLLVKEKPALYNQAIMDFGAVICKPQQPLCLECILQDQCCAYIKKSVHLLPLKSKKIEKRKRWFYYILLQSGNDVMLFHRNKKDIWKGLHEFLLLEQSDPIEIEQLIPGILADNFLPVKFSLKHISPDYIQQLTHQTIYGKFIKIYVQKFPTIPEAIIVQNKKVKQLAFPRMITQYLEDFPLQP